MKYIMILIGSLIALPVNAHHSSELEPVASFPLSGLSLVCLIGLLSFALLWVSRVLGTR